MVKSEEEHNFVVCREILSGILLSRSAANPERTVNRGKERKDKKISSLGREQIKEFLIEDVEEIAEFADVSPLH
jgi:hypothetical protein